MCWLVVSLVEGGRGDKIGVFKNRFTGRSIATLAVACLLTDLITYMKKLSRQVKCAVI